MTEIHEQVNWNVAKFLTIYIGMMLNQSGNDYAKGDLDSAFRKLKAIRMRIVQNLKPNEREKIKEQEQIVAKSIYEYSQSKKIPEVRILKFRESSYQYEKLNEMLMDMLDDKGYLIEKKKDASKMEF